MIGPSRLAVAAAVLALAVACTDSTGGDAGAAGDGSGSGSGGLADGPVTLTVWDQAFRGPELNQLKSLNRQFMETYPNVTIERTAHTASDIRGIGALLATGRDAPDVVQVDQGYADLGTFAEAGYLRPLDRYADKYGWADRYPSLVLDLARFDDEGTRGSGDLYGLAQLGEVVGLFYNKQQLIALDIPLPDTWEKFGAALATAHAAEVPGMLVTDPSAMFGLVHAETTDPEAGRDLVFGREGVSWEDESSVEAAELLRSWMVSGYVTLGGGDAWESFAAGKGLFLVDSSRRTAQLEVQMGADVGFMLLPRREAGAEPAATVGRSPAFAVSTGSEHPDVAAAYLDFITTGAAADVSVQAGVLPVVPPDEATVPADTVQADVVSAWRRVVGSAVPSLELTTPNFGTTLDEQVQQLALGHIDAQEFTSVLQRHHEMFHGA